MTARLMTQHQGTYLHILDRNRLPDGTELLHVDEVPPPYSTLENEDRSIESDWKVMNVEIQPMPDYRDKYGFAISGGIDTDEGSPIVITHIESASKTSFDNGRANLSLFDRIQSINGIDLTDVTHDKAARAFSLTQGQSISLGIRRLNPKNIEHIDFSIPSSRSKEPLGMTINGGLESHTDDPSLYITNIDPDGLLASVTKKNQLRKGDRLLEIRTNHTTVNLRWITRSKGGQLIRRTCQDHPRLTLVVAHQTT